MPSTVICGIVAGDRDDLPRRLLRRQLLADHAGARFVGAVVLAIAVVALDVAGRRDRDMHAGEVVMRLLAVAGMVLHLLPDLRRQVALARGRAAAGLAAAALAAAAGLLRLAAQMIEDRRIRRCRNRGVAAACSCPVLARSPRGCGGTSGDRCQPGRQNAAGICRHGDRSAVTRAAVTSAIACRLESIRPERRYCRPGTPRRIAACRSDRRIRCT